MRRITFSIIFGIIFPVVCLLTLGFLSKFMPQSFLFNIRIGDELAPGLLLAPFAIPIYIDIFLIKSRMMPGIFQAFWLRLLFLVLFNWALYGTIIYFLLGRLKRFKKSVAVSEIPPEPPQFDEN